jgi:glycosyltransferase involved in cell wall biosynthesis
VAIDVARAARRRLVIAGNIPDGEEHQRYFREEIQPRLDGDHITYVGPVDDVKKNEILSSAAALLMPVLWEEPFGIVMAEALACGTPVVGLGRGAVPEVVKDGVTGFVCRDAEAMTAAIGRLSSLRRNTCRQDAEARFSQRALVDAYEALYREVAPVSADLKVRPTKAVETHS